MSDCHVYYDELRFDVRDPEMTEVYVFIRTEGDCPHMLMGWHYKAFPASQTTQDIFAAMWDGKENPMMWPLKAPPQ